MRLKTKKICTSSLHLFKISTNNHWSYFLTVCVFNLSSWKVMVNTMWHNQQLVHTSYHVTKALKDEMFILHEDLHLIVQARLSPIWTWPQLFVIDNQLKDWFINSSEINNYYVIQRGLENKHVRLKLIIAGKFRLYTRNPFLRYMEMPW